MPAVNSPKKTCTPWVATSVAETQAADPVASNIVMSRATLAAPVPRRETRRAPASRRTALLGETTAAKASDEPPDRAH